LPAIDATNIAHWWPLLLASVLSVSIGLSLGGVLCWMLSLPRDLYGIVLACTALGNMGNLPLVLVATLAEDPQSPLFGLGEVAIAYVAFSLIPTSLSHFTLGFQLLKSSAVQALPLAATPRHAGITPAPNSGSNSDAEQAPAPPHHSSVASETWSPPASTASATALVAAEVPKAGPVPRNGIAPSPHANGGVNGAAAAPLRVEGRDAYGQEVVRRSGRGRALMHWLASSLHLSRDDSASKGPKGGMRVKDVLTPPTIACFLAVIVGFIVPVQKAIALRLDEAPGSRKPVLDVIGQTLTQLGDAAIPSMMIVLGGSLQKGPPTHTRLPSRAGIGIIIVKLLLVPAVGTSVWYGLLKARAFAVPDPAFMFVCLAMLAVPTAVNMQTIANIFGSGVEELAATMFWQYLVSILTIPPWMALFLVISDRAAKGTL